MDLLTSYKDKKMGGGGGNNEIKCNFREIITNGSYARVRAHLLKISRFGVKTCK